MQFLFAKSEAENYKKYCDLKIKSRGLLIIKKYYDFNFKTYDRKRAKKFYDFHFKSGRTDKNYHLHFYLTIVWLFDTIGYTLKGQVNSFLGIYIFFPKFFIYIFKQAFLDM